MRAVGLGSVHWLGTGPQLQRTQGLFPSAPVMSVAMQLPSRGVGVGNGSNGRKKKFQGVDETRPLKKVMAGTRKQKTYSPEPGEEDSDFLMTSLDMLNNHVEQNLCIEMLIDGCVESYCQFFKASEDLIRSRTEETPAQGHPQTCNASLSAPPKASGSEGDIARLINLKQNLMRSEQAMRKDSHTDVYEALMAVAAQFQGEGDYKSEQRFLQKCLDISKLIDDGNERLLEAQCKIGSAFENERNLTEATKYYSVYYDGCKDIEGKKTKACSLLVRVECETANELAVKGDFQGAIAKLESCFECTQGTNDPESMCKLYYDLGKHHLELQEYSKSINYYEKYFEIAEREGNDLNCGCVCAALATAYESTNDPEKATEFLERYLDYVKGHSVDEEAMACQRLGELYLGRNEHVKAVTHLQKYFDIIKEKSNGETAEVTGARVRIGIAKANLKMARFIECLRSNGPKDLQELIHWKNTRDDKCFRVTEEEAEP